jgi:bifunctional DNA-binding transcriptional regulator/antitoxin component of YhaV-PrlF toxin-antitoxin module
MSAMKRTAPARTGPEQLIGAVVPAPAPRPRPRPAPTPALPARRLPTGPDTPVFDIARLDASGRLSARRLLAALGWRPGHRVDIDVVDHVLVIASAGSGQHVVTARGELALPAATRQFCGIACGPVVLAAYPSMGTVTVHQADTVAGLLRDFHARLAGADHAG